MAEGTGNVLKGELQAFSLEYPCHSPDEQRWFRVEVRPLNEDGGSGAVVMHINITASKRAENEIKELNEHLENRVVKRTTELTEANKALEAFSYSVSHDLRAPVRTVIGFSDLIRKEYEKSFEPELRELFQHIEASGRRMNAIIDDMLMLAKYEKEILRIEPVDMNLLFENVWSKISYSQPHHATLELASLPEMHADTSMMEQVVVNLLSNAIKYSSKKDHPAITVGCEQTDTAITFYVRDNGAGFDMKNYSKLFGAFQRLHGTSEFEGTGVGLLLVKKIVEKHGGIVWAEGKVGEGATFYFTLPMQVV
jgi:light-regulated signal transduction histidine kinase (bacteriophytochrome)